MTYHPETARCVFIDGPVSVYVQDADPDEILAAYARLDKLVAVCAEEFRKANKPGDPLEVPFAGGTTRIPAAHLIPVWDETTGKMV